MEQTLFRITGMHCAACIKVATLKLKKIPGVTEVTVLPSGEVTLGAGRKISLEEAKKSLEGTEYRIE